MITFLYAFSALPVHSSVSTRNRDDMVVVFEGAGLARLVTGRAKYQDEVI